MLFYQMFTFSMPLSEVSEEYPLSSYCWAMPSMLYSQTEQCATLRFWPPSASAFSRPFGTEVTHSLGQFRSAPRLSRSEYVTTARCSRRKARDPLKNLKLPAQQDMASTTV